MASLRGDVFPTRRANLTNSTIFFKSAFSGRINEHHIRNPVNAKRDNNTNRIRPRSSADLVRAAREGLERSRATQQRISQRSETSERKARTIVPRDHGWFIIDTRVKYFFPGPGGSYKKSSATPRTRSEGRNTYWGARGTSAC